MTIFVPVVSTGSATTLSEKLAAGRSPHTMAPALNVSLVSNSSNTAALSFLFSACQVVELSPSTIDMITSPSRPEVKLCASAWHSVSEPRVLNCFTCTGTVSSAPGSRVWYLNPEILRSPLKSGSSTGSKWSTRWSRCSGVTAYENLTPVSPKNTTSACLIKTDEFIVSYSSVMLSLDCGRYMFSIIFSCVELDGLPRCRATRSAHFITWLMTTAVYAALSLKLAYSSGSVRLCVVYFCTVSLYLTYPAKKSAASRNTGQPYCSRCSSLIAPLKYAFHTE
ncbi:hypothetical protein OGATHE_004492 [Ogataea polymorpha]|uniref:Uncharacterized protein n=1 Tax=Ogataea polymorpha TaxID=460523 RepID=A0A9P8T2M7_9ASCO|nr:hypothetical protein OGATHE_004492 [Ogataea polymorpha]